MERNKLKWKEYGNHNPKDVAFIKRAAKNHNINIKINSDGLLFVDFSQFEKQPKNLKLFNITVNAFHVCRQIEDIWKKHGRRPDDVETCINDLFNDPLKTGVISPINMDNIIPKTNEQVFREARNSLMVSGAIAPHYLDEIQGYNKI
jgi:hypothetical protein